MNILRKKLGERIRGLRMSTGLTQEELGEKAELSYKFLGEIERGQVNISLDSLEKIANALDIKIENLFSKDKIYIQKIITKERNPLSKFSSKDMVLIKKALRLLNKSFPKS
ncbi:MAG: helix-turn-helix transcriptional regulator [bacterium]